MNSRFGRLGPSDGLGAERPALLLGAQGNGFIIINDEWEAARWLLLPLPGRDGMEFALCSLSMCGGGTGGVCANIMQISCEL